MSGDLDNGNDLDESEYNEFENITDGVSDTDEDDVEEEIGKWKVETNPSFLLAISINDTKDFNN